jgi:hypothetical protein
MRPNVSSTFLNKPSKVYEQNKSIEKVPFKFVDFVETFVDDKMLPVGVDNSSLNDSSTDCETDRPKITKLNNLDFDKKTEIVDDTKEEASDNDEEDEIIRGLSLVNLDGSQGLAFSPKGPTFRRHENCNRPAPYPVWISL